MEALEDKKNSHNSDFMCHNMNLLLQLSHITFFLRAEMKLLVTLHVTREVVKLFLLIMISLLLGMVEFKLQFLIRNWFRAQSLHFTRT